MVARSLRHSWANLSLLLLLLLQVVTGSAGLFGTGDPFRVVFWLHAVGAYAIVVVLLAKGLVVYDAVRRRPGISQARIALTVLVVLLAAVLVTGFLWISAGYRSVGGTSVINLHAYLAILLVVLLGWHIVDRRWIVRVPAARDRAAFLRLAGVVVAGVVLWQAERAVQELLGTPGSRRRFTGSYERGSFGGAFPAVSWLNDDPEPVERSTWRLVVDGEVAHPLDLGYEELEIMAAATATAALDCTGGWYTVQEWEGVRVAAILDAAELKAEAESVSVESVTGYGRRFSVAHARELTLALRVAGEPLTHGHGAPARLVVPDRRGFDWVKWVVRISAGRSSHLLQPPLPLT